MPRDGLAFAVRVGGQDELFGAFHSPGDVTHDLYGLAVDIPMHEKIVVGLDRAVLGQQVTHMTIGGQNRIVRAQVLIDRLGLGGRFHDDDSHHTSGVAWERAGGVRYIKYRLGAQRPRKMAIRCAEVKLGLFKGSQSISPCVKWGRQEPR